MTQHTSASHLVGRNMAIYRKALGLSQPEFGYMISWSRQQVSQAELGNRAFVAADIMKVASLLGVQVADLFRALPDEEEPEPSEEEQAMNTWRRLQAARKRALVEV